MIEFDLNKGPYYKADSGQGGGESPNGNGEEIETPEWLKEEVRKLGDRVFNNAVQNGLIAPVVTKEVLKNKNIKIPRK